MEKKEFDVVTIGSATMDAFIESDKASVVNVSTIDHNTELMAFPYGSKLEITDFTLSSGGGGINTAANFANLGLKTSTIIKLGEDNIKETILKLLKEKNVDTSNIAISNKIGSGFSVILVSFQGDRTVLAHRGANSKITKQDINFDAIKKSKWLYVAPLAGDSNKVLDEIAQFAEENGTNLAINAGTTAIKKGANYFSKIIKTAEILVLNKEEAQMLTKISVRPDTKDIFYSKEDIHPDIKTMLQKLRENSHAIVVITDGKHGAYAYDGKKLYVCPPFDGPVRSTLGAGDAFASTFTAAIERTNWNVELSLKMASVNSSSVVEQFGAQDGLISFDTIEEKLKNSPDYKVKVIDEIG